MKLISLSHGGVILLLIVKQTCRSSQPENRLAEAVAAAFTSKRSKVVPLHWTCCLEKHENGGYHYHLALKLSGTKRWLEAKKFIEAEHGIAVNFSDHDGYYTA